jgi:23S rRNA (pseudouridine1915-N3)-methyltransferase
MRIRFLFLGKTRRPEIRALLEDYAQRLRRFTELEIHEVREDSPAALRKIAMAVGATIVLLDARGKHLDSPKFAAWLGASRDRGVREIVFLCGAAKGFPPAITDSANMRISLSPLTFSHELARVMLAEQLYRAFAILAGHPYPK